ncbi:MAG: dTDP-glucose 4,6-dehydratase [bacterium]
MKILVTGGAGFIGSNFIHYILNKYPDYQVVNLDLLTYAGNLENLKDVEDNDNYRFIKGDIADKEIMSNIINDIDLIVNFAAESHNDRAIIDSSDFIRTNILGTHNLLESARENNIRFHHISTDEVYGHLGHDDQAFNERTSFSPRSPYSASKAASDHLALSYFHTYNLPVTISNCSNNYGPYQFPEKLHALFITNLLEDKKIPVYGDGLQIRDWLYVEDHCRAIDLIIHRGKIGDTYCVGGGCEKTNLEVVKKILQLLGKTEDLVEFVKDRPGHDKRYAMDYSKIKEELGWEPSVDFEQGMKKTVQWYQDHKDWWGRCKSGHYQEYYNK